MRRTPATGPATCAAAHPAWPCGRGPCRRSQEAVAFARAAPRASARHPQRRSRHLRAVPQPRRAGHRRQRARARSRSSTSRPARSASDPVRGGADVARTLAPHGLGDQQRRLRRRGGRWAGDCGRGGLVRSLARADHRPPRPRSSSCSPTDVSCVPLPTTSPTSSGPCAGRGRTSASPRPSTSPRSARRHDRVRSSPSTPATPPTFLERWGRAIEEADRSAHRPGRPGPSGAAVGGSRRRCSSSTQTSPRPSWSGCS